MKALLSLGSNLGNRQKNVEEAIAHLETLGELTPSSMYRTEPHRIVTEHWFVNSAAVLETTLDAKELLEAVQRIEREMGRDRSHDNRVIDIDILLCGEEVHDDDPIVPHPRMHERNFVLVPAAELAPKMRHPVLEKTIQQLRDQCPDESAVSLIE